MQRDRIGVGIYQSCLGQASAERRRKARFAAWLTGLLLSAALWPAGTLAQVPFVPTPPDVVKRMLEIAKVGPHDYVVDLGSGDGRILRTAAREFGARGFGVEHDRALVERSLELARREGVSDKVSFIAEDLFEVDISDATVVTLYLFPAINLKLRPRLLKLKPGTRIVSHDFDMGDWTPDATEKLYSPEKYGSTGGEATIHLWIVPADVSGRWTWRLEIGGEAQDYELSAQQRFQKVEATLRIGGKPRPVRDFELEGDQVSFTVAGEIKGSTVYQTFSGRVRGDTIEGSVRSSGPRLQGVSDWVAQRSERGYRSAAAPRRLPALASAQAGSPALWTPSGSVR